MLQALVRLQLFAVFVAGIYRINLEAELDEWSEIEVQHWLVERRFPELVHPFSKLHVDGEMLQDITEQQLIQAGLDDKITRAALMSQVKRLQESITDYNTSLIAFDDVIHMCQDLPSDLCPYTYSWADMMQLIFPRLSIFWNGLYGRGLFSLPLRHIVLWIFLPHSAVLHAHLEVFGLHMSFSNLAMTSLNVIASHFGLLVDLALAMFVIQKVFGRFVDRDNFDNLGQLAKLAGHLLCIIVLPVDWLLGWRIGWIRIMLTARDVMMVYSGLTWLEKQVPSSSS